MSYGLCMLGACIVALVVFILGMLVQLIPDHDARSEQGE